MVRRLVRGLHFDNHYSRIEISYTMQLILNLEIYLQLGGGEEEFGYIMFLYVGDST